MSPPLAVHLVFHPHSQEARKLAVRIHRELNDDPAVPGLRVPTVLCREDGSGHPPRLHALDTAERSFVVVLADDDMVIEQPSRPSDRLLWSTFVGNLWEQCQSAPRRLLPVQLSASAFPLDDRMCGISFPRAYAEPEAERPAWVVRRVIVELLRFLLRLEMGVRAPVQLFLSHSKQDLDREPKVFRAIEDHLKVTQPITAWVDSAQIEGGSQFAEAIEQGVQDSALLVLATQSYSSRPWCRREVLLAKEHQRPVVVVDAIEGLDVRGFPYLGNVPLIAWRGGSAPRAIDLVLKEFLRSVHVRQVLDHAKRPGDRVLAAPPELATIVALPRGTNVLYPDPPLGDEEAALFKPLGHRIQTPLQRAAEGRPLSGWEIALSVSEADDSAQYGVLPGEEDEKYFHPGHLDAVLLELSQQLLVRGCSLAYGGHLGKAGYTLRLFDLVRAHQERSTLPPVERIKNYLGWPVPQPKALRAERQRRATFISVGRPAGIEELEPATFVEEPHFFEANSPERRYAWARGMAAMRERQTSEVRARIVIGGTMGPTVKARADGGRQLEWYRGRIPGVMEEALLTLQANKALYVVGAFGGAAAALADLLEGRARGDFTWEFHRQAPHSEGMRRFYEERGGFWDYPDMTRFLTEIGVAGLAARNGLDEAGNRELFYCRDSRRIIELILVGLSRIAARSVVP